MTDFEREVLLLIKSALNGTSETISKEFDWDKAVSLAKSHNIAPIMYYGIQYSNVDLPDSAKNEFRKLLLKHIIIDESQRRQIKLLTAAFDANGIEYMPLKGINLKKMYPLPEMRPMGDADILIKEEQYEKIKGIMNNLGFVESIESDHELSWRSSDLYVELHKRVIPSYNKDFYQYFGNGWKLAHRCDDNANRYEMSSEDELVYIFTHMAKHYRDGGIGIRHLIDIYVCYANRDNLNYDYINKELEKLQLNKFFNNIISMLKVWFDGAENTVMTDYITDFVFSSGSYGTFERHALSGAVKASKAIKSVILVKFKKFIELAFPSYEVMRNKYKFLNKVPFLMPIMWIWRILIAAFLKVNRIKDNYKKLKIVKKENISDYQSSLNYVGLDFNFK